MSKYSFLIASCFLFGTQLHADSIQTLTITFLTASTSGTGPLVSFMASGPSVKLSGQQGFFGIPLPPIPPGPFFGPVVIALPPNGTPNLFLDGFLTNGTELQLQGEPNPPGFGPVVSGTANLPIPANGGTIVFPGTVKGGYLAVECGKLEVPPNCTGPQANIPLDFPGLFSLTFSAPGPLGNVQLETESFTSIPEPSSALLVLLGAAAVTAASMTRRRRST